MTPDIFRQLLLKVDAGELVRTHIVNDDPGPIISAEILRHIEDVIRAKFRLKDDQRVNAVVVGSAKLGFSFLTKQKNGVTKPAYRSYRPGISDIDIAIISPVVYGKIWSDLASTGARATPFPNNSKLGRYMYLNHPGNRGGCLVKVKQVPQRMPRVVDSNALRPQPAGYHRSTPASVDG